MCMKWVLNLKVLASLKIVTNFYKSVCNIQKSALIQILTHLIFFLSLMLLFLLLLQKHVLFPPSAKTEMVKMDVFLSLSI